MEQALTVSEDGPHPVEFDTLWAQVQACLATYAPRLPADAAWSDFSDHDPGVTLLQALSYVCAGLSVRHTWTLRDLLTPAPDVVKRMVPGTSGTSHDTSPDTSHVPAGGTQQGGLLFAPAFGPERALTCGPVTLDDYRRALLDLTAKDGQGNWHFCLDDVSLALSAPGEGYRYSYDAATLEFRFATTPGPGDFVIPGYTLWAVRHPELTLEVVQQALEQFFAEHRNLCESPPAICWINPAPVRPALTIELDPDFVASDSTVAQVVAQVVQAVCDWFCPRVLREDAAGLLHEQAHAAEDIYRGPALRHGWIMALPPAIDYATPRQFDEAELTANLVALDGIAAVLKVKLPPEFQVGAGCAPCVWPGPQKQKEQGRPDLADVIQNIELRKQGQKIVLDTELRKSEIKKALAQQWAEWDRRAAPDTQELPRALQLPYGQYRAPGRYVSAGSHLPACYGLQQVWPDDTSASHASREAVRQLFLFLLPFEQALANRADQLERLWQVLSFDQRSGDGVYDPLHAPGQRPSEQQPPAGPFVWGRAQRLCTFDTALCGDARADEPHRENARWILADSGHTDSGHTSSGEAHSGGAPDDTPGMKKLGKQVCRQSLDPEKELSILNYLLGYFGRRRAERTLLEAPDFLRVQQGYLRQITALDYARAEINPGQPSALQRRIAARLGVGPVLFTEPGAEPAYPDGQAWPHFRQWPFFVLEHAALLPQAPAGADLARGWQPLVGASQKPTLADQAGSLTLVLGGAPDLKTGQLIDLLPPQAADAAAMIPILASVIHQVSPAVANPSLKDGHGQHMQEVQIDLTQHEYLASRAPGLVKELAGRKPADQKTWSWRLSSVWLRRKRFALEYRHHTLPDQTNPYLTAEEFTERKAWLQTASLPAELTPGMTVMLSQIDPLQPEAPRQIVPLVVETVDPGEGWFKVQPDSSVGKDFKWPSKQLAQWGWSIPFQGDLFAQTLSIVLPRARLSPTQIADPLAIDRWVRTIVAEEVPTHLAFRIHWLGENDFAQFRDTYRDWQAGNRQAGDLVYRLLDLIGLGSAPIDRRKGIEAMHIVDPVTEQQWLKDGVDVAALDRVRVFYAVDPQ